MSKKPKLTDAINILSSWLIDQVKEQISQQIDDKFIVSLEEITPILSCFNQLDNQNKKLTYQLEAMQKQLAQWGTNNQLLESAN